MRRTSRLVSHVPLRDVEKPLSADVLSMVGDGCDGSSVDEQSFGCTGNFNASGESRPVLEPGTRMATPSERLACELKNPPAALRVAVLIRHQRSGNHGSQTILLTARSTTAATLRGRALAEGAFFQAARRAARSESPVPAKRSHKSSLFHVTKRDARDESARPTRRDSLPRPHEGIDHVARAIASVGRFASPQGNGRPNVR